ncbi:hypothetical protein Ndes2526B_g04031 [Nannochloris sp. 'desiccata']|nr:hypothetical protein KSW81_005987 [Chlorella desiccata (nom. nud.)]KAH7621219.1 hypothetical protein NADE_009265 [Chlorella desiccata (nom. nud.)]
MYASATFTIGHLMLATGPNSAPATHAQLRYYHDLLRRAKKKEEPLMPKTVGWVSRCIGEMEHELGISTTYQYDEVKLEEIPVMERERLTYLKRNPDPYQPLVIKKAPADVQTPTKISQ